MTREYATTDDTEYTLEVSTRADSTNTHPDYHAMLKWDGCVHFWRDYPADDSDYLHICDLDQAIEVLTHLRDMGRQKFGAEWK